MWFDLLVIVVCFVVFGRASVRAAEQHGVTRTFRIDGGDDTHHDIAPADILQVRL